MNKSTTWLAMVASALMVSSCATPAGDPTATGPGNAQAQKQPAPLIDRVEAMESERGSKVVISGTGSLPYRAFRLSNPPRVLLTFTGATLSPAVQPQLVDLNTVSGFFPMLSKEGEPRVEITLKGEREFDVEPRPNGVTVNILKEGQAATPAGGTAKPAPGTTVADVKIASTPEGTRIQLVGAKGRLPSPQAFRINDPPRLVVDLYGVDGRGQNRKLDNTTPEMSGALLAGNADKTRLVVNLMDTGVTFRVGEVEGSPVITLSHAGTTAKEGPAAVEGVEHQRDGAASLVRVTLSRSDVKVQTRREGNDVVVDLKGVKVPKAVVRRMDVTEFGTPLKAVDTYPDGNDGRLVLRLAAADAKHQLLQKGREVVVRVAPKDVIKDETKKVYTGPLLSLDFKDIEVANALDLVAEQLGYQLYAHESVKGKIAFLQLNEVPADQALEIILDKAGLSMQLEGEVLIVGSREYFKDNAKAKREVEDSATEAEPLVTEIIPVSFASVEELQKLLMAGSAPAAGADAKEGEAPPAANSGFLTSRASITIDIRTSSLIVREVASNMQKIRDMVRTLDKPIPQVLIEARVVSMSRENTEDIGIQWGVTTQNNPDAHKNRWGISDSAYRAAQQAGMRDPLADWEWEPKTPNSAILVPWRPFSVSNAPNPLQRKIGFHLGSVNPIVDLDVELNALENLKKAKIISTPKVVTVNNKEAVIEQGVEIPYKVVSAQGVNTVFKKAVLSLKVTPQVTPDEHITMDVTVTNDSLSGETSEGVPILNKEQVTSKILVRSGNTVVLGGVLQESSSDGVDGVPGLTDVPVLGWLFKHTTDRKVNKELMIFLTPRVVNEAS